MNADSLGYNVSDADVFSRGSLKLSYDLLRKPNPALALQVRNIINGEALPKAEDSENKNSDHFRVTLDSFQVRAVVEGLMEYNQNEILAKQQPGFISLTENALDLAKQGITTLDEVLRIAGDLDVKEPISANNSIAE